MDVEYQVVVIGHHHIGAHLDGEDGGELTNPSDHPMAPVLEAAPGEGVLSAQEGAANAAGDAVVVGGIGERDLALPWTGHGALLPVVGLWGRMAETPSHPNSTGQVFRRRQFVGRAQRPRSRYGQRPLRR